MFWFELLSYLSEVDKIELNPEVIVRSLYIKLQPNTAVLLFSAFIFYLICKAL